MKHYSSADIGALERRFRANLVNSVTGFKPANLIGTVDGAGLTNLALFSSAVHIGADPPLIGIVFRPLKAAERHTYHNIASSGVYTINHVPIDMTRNAHLTSAKFPRAVSEFGVCGFNEEFVEGFRAPFVHESAVKMGMRLVEELEIQANGTLFLIGEVMHLLVPEHCITDSGRVDIAAAGTACVSGLDTYHSVGPGSTYPYAKPEHAERFEK